MPNIFGSPPLNFFLDRPMIIYVFIGNEKYSHFIDSMWKDISAAQAACDSIDNTETVKILDVLENSEGILVSGMGKFLCKGSS